MSGQCELCGNISGKILKRKVENVEMGVCSNCAKFGARQRSPAEYRAIHSKISSGQLKRRVKQFNNAQRNRKSGKFDLESGERVIAENVSLIRTYVNKSGMTNDEFARKINEKASYVSQVLSGKILPSIEMARKIEKLFKIELVEAFDNSTSGNLATAENSKVSSEGLTIGDLIKQKMSK